MGCNEEALKGSMECEAEHGLTKISGSQYLEPVWQKRGAGEGGSLCVYAKPLHLYLTLCDPRDCSPPGSSVHGILQTRILEWLAMPSSRGSS